MLKAMGCILVVQVNCPGNECPGFWAKLAWFVVMLTQPVAQPFASLILTGLVFLY
jgi:hypothetical protein